MLPINQKKPRRLTESTTEASGTDNSTSSDTPPEGNRAVPAEYHIIDVDFPPNPQLINTRSPVSSPRLIQPMSLCPHSVLTEQRLVPPIHIPSPSFLQPIPSTSAYTPPALCNDSDHQQLPLSIKEELGRMSDKLLNFIMCPNFRASYMPQHIKGGAAEKGCQAVSSPSAVRTNADFEALEDFLLEDSNVKCFVCVRQWLQPDPFLSGAVHEPAWWDFRKGIVAQHSYA
ncbi:hypothetical protein PHET_12267 [Paragonimus heterotremus]|uniref:Uncharacterized protein n=1 Tax=Paragonimus heterotremus TaxID=100268 RepID=A0A8J4SYX1_9TREM|nr:hypothetical protein PHET_12267 [Paragonimus heterotremus]